METYRIYGTEYKRDEATWDSKVVAHHTDLLIDLEPFTTTQEDLDWVGYLVSKKFGFEAFEVLGFSLK